MTNMLHMLMILTIPLSLGWVITLYITRHKPLPIPFSLALGFGLGTGLLTHIILFLGFLKIPFSASVINFPILIITIGFLILLLRNRPARLPNQKIKTEKMDLVTAAFALYIIIFLCYILWRSLTIPINTWDSFSTMALKSKVFYFDQSLAHLSGVPKFSYPLHVPFLLVWSALSLNGWDDQLPKIVFPLTSISFMIIQYYFLKTYTQTRWALFGLVLLISSNFYLFHSTISYRDITMLYFNCTAILLLILWHTKKDAYLLILAGLFSGFTAFIKLEGTGYFFIHLILLAYVLIKTPPLSFRKKWTQAMKFIVPGALLCSSYHMYKFIHLADMMRRNPKSQNDFNFHELSLTLSGEIFVKLGVILGRFIENLFLSGNWNIVWFMLVMSLVMAQKDRFKFEIKSLIMMICIFFMLYISAYTLTQHFVWVAYKEDVLSRSILHFFPLAISLVILLNCNRKNFNN